MHETHSWRQYAKQKRAVQRDLKPLVAWNAGSGKTSALGGTQMKETWRNELHNANLAGRVPGPKYQVKWYLNRDTRPLPLPK